MPEEKSVSLYFSEGSSDKVYQAQLKEGADGWSVTFQYGRRGKALTAGEKGSGLSYEKALGIYEKLVLSKTSKGYTPDVSGVAFSSTEFAGRVTGYAPQLLNEITLDEARILGDDWLVQEKHDGERRGLLADENGLRFANRKGLEVAVQAPVAEAFGELHRIVGGTLKLDAEDMGGHGEVFDVQAHFMLDLGTFRERAAILHHLQKTILDAGLGEALVVDVPSPAGHFFKSGMAENLMQAKAEGFVLRRADSLYTPGRPASGGDALKVKFWEDVTCRVTAGRDGKASVGLELLDENEAWIAVGNVTIPNNAPMPTPGSLIDVRYLYAFPGGSLLEPTFKGVRTDIDAADCKMSRLKFKRQDAAPMPEDAPAP